MAIFVISVSTSWEKHFRNKIRFDEISHILSRMHAFSVLFFSGHKYAEESWERGLVYWGCMDIGLWLGASCHALFVCLFWSTCGHSIPKWEKDLLKFSFLSRMPREFWIVDVPVFRGSVARIPNMLILTMICVFAHILFRKEYTDQVFLGKIFIKWLFSWIRCVIIVHILWVWW